MTRQFGEAVAPSTASVIHEADGYLSFPAIAAAGERLLVIFRQATGNPLDFTSRILICHSDDAGHSWSEPDVWVDEPDADSRNCGGGTLPGGLAHFVYDLHGGGGAWRRTYYRTSTDGTHWSEPIRLAADIPNEGAEQITSIGNRGLLWDEHGTLYFPHFLHFGRSVLVHADGSQTQIASVPRTEPAIAWNRQGELVAFSKGGAVDISSDRGATWRAATQLDTLSQPDLIQLGDRRLLFCYSGENRRSEFLLLSKDGHDWQDAVPLKIFAGVNDGALDSRGKAQCLQWGDEILTVVYESYASQGTGRVYLIRTPLAAFENG